MEQAMAICGVLSILNPLHILNAIDNTCRSGSPSDEAELKTALLMQHDLSAALSWLKLPEEDELEGEEPEEEVGTMNRGGAPATIYHLWQPVPSWTCWSDRTRA